MTNRHIGTVPFIPSWLSWIPGLTGRMPAERLIALRMIVGFVVCFDLLFTYWPNRSIWLDLLNADPFRERFQFPHWRWSITRIIGFDGTIICGLFGCLGMIFGRWIRGSTFLTFLTAVSLTNDDPMTTNGGDLLRSSLLLILTVSYPVVQSRDDDGRSILVPSWPSTVLLLQLCLLYFMNGVYKAQSPSWRDGTVMAGILSDWYWSTIPGFAAAIPDSLSRLMALFALGWELTFPVCLFWPRVRWIWLSFGITFHIVTSLTLTIGFFPIYSLCFYVPFIPWERLRKVPS